MCIENIQASKGIGGTGGVAYIRRSGKASLRRRAFETHLSEVGSESHKVGKERLRMSDPSPRVRGVKVYHLRIVRKPNVARGLQDESLDSLPLSVLTVSIISVGTELAALSSANRNSGSIPQPGRGQVPGLVTRTGHEAVKPKPDLSAGQGLGLRSQAATSWQNWDMRWTNRQCLDVESQGRERKTSRPHLPQPHTDCRLLLCLQLFPPSCLLHSRHTCHLARHTPASNSLTLLFRPSGIPPPIPSGFIPSSTSSLEQMSLSQ